MKHELPSRSGGYPGLAEATRVWARIALLSFGGPAGQIAVMHRILVEEKRWLGDGRFLHALNFCMLLPGPEAQQLATYIGWLLHRTRGGLIAGALFVLPGLLAIMALSIIYALYGNAGPVAGLFFGLKAAVLAIVLQAVVRIGSRALRNNVLRGLAALSFIGIFAFGVPFPLIVLAAAAAGWLGARAGLAAFRSSGGHGSAGTHVEDRDTLLGAELDAIPADARRGALRAGSVCLALWLLPVAALWLVAPQSVFADIAIFFSQMAVVTFGGAYAVLAYVAQEAVGTYGWLGPGEMLDGLGMAETTPGPLIMVTQFVGFLGAFRDPGSLPPLLAAVLGGLLTTWVTFAPCFAWIFLGAPWMERLRSNHALSGALTAVTASVVGVILNLALWFGLHVLFSEVRRLTAGPLSVELPVPGSLDPVAALLALAALVAVFRLRLGTMTVLAAAGGAGIVLHLLGLR
ncbi:chromate efflux transporter [Cereibacter sphaeroides]|uniref:chromate efflux transporter n=1 Tax=Cereibacter sphaeroides TaxID=1063 RepID=UPI001F2E2096|nr:chromate efflux transporter [Cereibacter sphaeroides]MCE6959146.1 chromate efflux transporter [Cereibacter sphaeroides]MCE6968387.1 chromate efflux transporter [Cereibacter sphaeroides]MCE6974193.1 chromate efflux transporter [Cereibacter sphaeroides]